MSCSCLRRPPAAARVTAQARFDEGNAFYQQAKWDEALAAFRAAVEKDPDMSPAWFAIGMATTMKHGGPCEAAYGAFKRFVDLDPNHAPGHDNLGNTLIARKDYPRAEEHFRAAIRLDPKHAGAQQGLAVVLRKRGDLDGAMRAALEYVRLSGDPEGSGKVIVAKLRAQKKASPPAAKPDAEAQARFPPLPVARAPQRSATSRD